MTDVGCSVIFQSKVLGGGGGGEGGGEALMSVFVNPSHDLQTFDSVCVHPAHDLHF